MSTHMFRYCLDPIALCAMGIYLFNRFVIRSSNWGDIPFVREHLNDLLCLPIFLPAVLLVHRGMGLRRHDGPPSRFEILYHLVIWSIIFEGIAPSMTNVYQTTADPLDVVAYVAGALAAGMMWGSWRKHESGARSAPREQMTFNEIAHAGRQPDLAMRPV